MGVTVATGALLGVTVATGALLGVVASDVCLVAAASVGVVMGLCASSFGALPDTPFGEGDSFLFWGCPTGTAGMGSSSLQ